MKIAKVKSKERKSRVWPFLNQRRKNKGGSIAYPFVSRDLWLPSASAVLVALSASVWCSLASGVKLLVGQRWSQQRTVLPLREIHSFSFSVLKDRKVVSLSSYAFSWEEHFWYDRTAVFAVENRARNLLDQGISHRLISLWICWNFRGH